MELQKSITKENIETLVTLFYHQAMKDDQIGHFFVLELGDDIENEDWEEHIGRLVDFWATLLLDEDLYFSDPYGPHFSITDLKGEDFKRWIEVFSKTADEVYVPEISKIFKDEGIAYSKDFMKRLQTDHNLDELKSSISWE